MLQAAPPGEDGVVKEFRARQQRLQTLVPLAEFAAHRLDGRTLTHTIAYCRFNEAACGAAGISLTEEDTVEDLMQRLKRFIQLCELCRASQNSLPPLPPRLRTRPPARLSTLCFGGFFTP